MIRGRPWAALVACALAMACGRVPTERLAWRESWELVGLDAGGTVTAIRFTRGNTGLLRGQAHVVAEALPRNESPVHMHRGGAPWEVQSDDTSLRVGANGVALEGAEARIELREGSDAMDASLRLRTEAPAVPPVTLVPGDRQWILGVPVPRGRLVGAWRAGVQGAVVEGAGVLLRQSTDLLSPGTRRDLLVLFGEGVVVGVARAGDGTLAWVAEGSEVRTGRRATFRQQGRTLQVSLEPDLPVHLEVRLRRVQLVGDPGERLLLPERLLAPRLGLAGLRILRRGLGQGTVDGRAVAGQALRISSEPAEP